MKPNEKYGRLATDKIIQKTIRALRSNNFQVELVKNGQEAKKKVLELIPAGAEVMTMTSQTLEATGVNKEINESGKYNAVRARLMSMDKNTQAQEMNRLGAAPEFAVGSVHAVTEDGHILIASASGSQLPAYAYSAGKIIWVVGTQKIVKNTDEGVKRIYQYVFPLENVRSQKAYGVGSGVNKLLIINKEAKPARITLILVKEKLGF